MEQNVCEGDFVDCLNFAQNFFQVLAPDQSDMEAKAKQNIEQENGCNTSILMNYVLTRNPARLIK